MASKDPSAPANPAEGVSNAELSNSYGPELHTQDPQKEVSSHSTPQIAAYVQPVGPNGHIGMYEPPPEEVKSPQPRRRFTTLSVAILAFSAAVVLVGAILGGALGGKLSSCQNKLHEATNGGVPNLTCSPSSTNTSSPSSPSSSSSGLVSNYTVIDKSKVDSLASECPGLNSQSLATHTGDKFSVICGFDIGSGGQATGGGVVADIVGIAAYSVSDCANACSEYTRKSAFWKVSNKCASFTFDTDMKNVTATSGGNCWLKNGTLVNNSDMGPSARSVSGKVV